MEKAEVQVEAEGDENSALGTQDSELWVEDGGRRLEVRVRLRLRFSRKNRGWRQEGWRQEVR